MTEKKEFDVFLCHNSDDKDIIKLIAEKLEKEGIKTWLDEREFVGGDHWIKKLYETLDQANVVFVFLGINGIGKWHYEEIEYSYSLYVDSGKKPKIVPILLFGATFDQLPSSVNYLKNIQFVKINNLDDSETSKLLKIFPKFDKNGIQMDYNINNIKSTLEAITKKQHTTTDLENLRRLLNSENIEILINTIVGQDIVVKVENHGIIINDRMYQNWDKKAIKALVKAIQKVKQENITTPTETKNMKIKGDGIGITYHGDIHQTFKR